MAQLRNKRQINSAGEAFGCAILVLGGVVLITGIVLGVDWLIWKCWNYVVPTAFHGPVLTFWQVVIGMFLLGFLGNIFRTTVSVKKGD